LIASKFKLSSEFDCLVRLLIGSRVSLSGILETQRRIRVWG
jgi:hypothetical protein